jgi:hypothetical protein
MCRDGSRHRLTKGPLTYPKVARSFRAPYPCSSHFIIFRVFAFRMGGRERGWVCNFFMSSVSIINSLLLLGCLFYVFVSFRFVVVAF